MAKERLPRWADHLYTGNSFEWDPLHKFDFVRTKLVYVPAEHEREYIEHLLGNYLKKDGRLLIANYAEDHPHPEKTVESVDIVSANGQVIPFVIALTVDPISPD